MAYRVRILLLLTLTFAARIAAADETIDPTDARGLQDAVDRLEPGDTLTLRAGDYDLRCVADLPHHAVTVSRRGVTIRGEAGARLVGPPADLFGPWTFGLLLYATDSVHIEGLAFSGFVTAIGVGFVPTSGVE